MSDGSVLNGGGSGGLRIALVDHAFEHPSVELAWALAAAGHTPTVLTTRRGRYRAGQENGVEIVWVPRLPETLLARRGFVGPLTHVPAVSVTLSARRFTIVHAFTPPDALAARLAQSVAPAPLVYTCRERIVRERLADRRLRRPLLTRALERSDSVLVDGPEECAAVLRWFALEAEEVDAANAEAHVHVYRRVLADRCPPI